ncbi:hypothetical protein GGQ59_002240 [Parvularcula dongshanensis]|uniref:Tryptophan halogenase n=2 Tax=Parvularcula dongshanensis TaxID=1173995 RepID=A0A840I4A9_9PROT|nr:hypothetical protein [Parvularcula dongshanensis]
MNANDPNAQSLVVICGSGLAGQMCAAALSRRLPASVAIEVVPTPRDHDADFFYGQVTGPSAYAFNLAAGVSEPDLVLRSAMSFAYGTHYERWGDRSWHQCHHLPLPVIGNVAFHHFLTQTGRTQLEPFLLPAIAAARGAFAHPPERGASPLARAEYGYQIEPSAYAGLFETAGGLRYDRTKALLNDVEVASGRIASLRLSDGSVVRGDFYVDATGPQALLLSAVGVPQERSGRQVRGEAFRRSCERLGPPVRVVRAGGRGWTSAAHLRDGVHFLELSEEDERRSDATPDFEDLRQSCTLTLGKRTMAWRGNCVGIGHSAAVLEPITPAPIMMLERDIERVISLVPVAPEMSVEEELYNRRHRDDFENAFAFNASLYGTPHLPKGAFWATARDQLLPERLSAKLSAFTRRGVSVTFDHEPFNEEDWLIQHFGMGRVPERYDRFAEGAGGARLSAQLDEMRDSIARFARTMPLHHQYMDGLELYIRRNAETNDNDT